METRQRELEFSLAEVLAELKTLVKGYSQHPSFGAIERAELLLTKSPTS